MAEQGFEYRLARHLNEIAVRGLQRRLVSLCPEGEKYIFHRDDRYLNLASNDYLGLAGDRTLLDQWYRRLRKEPDLPRPGSGASRLMTGNHSLYSRLENSLAHMYGCDRAVVFNSGYHLNIGLLPALTTGKDLVLADKLCHASLIDGMRLCRARHIRYPHLDYSRLEELLAEKRDQYDQVFIVTESLFSMDGDRADLVSLAALAARYRAVLYVDEAHAVGVLGSRGLGLAEEQGVVGKIDLLVGTFGKAWGGQGAFLLCSRTVADYLVSAARSLIYTTGLPPLALHWLCFVQERISAMGEQRRHLQTLADRLRTALSAEGLHTGGRSQIVPVLGGEAQRVTRAAAMLRENGFWTVAVRPPTVPEGTARLRLSLTAAMQWQDLAGLPRALARSLSG